MQIGRLTGIGPSQKAIVPDIRNRLIYRYGTETHFYRCLWADQRIMEQVCGLILSNGLLTQIFTRDKYLLLPELPMKLMAASLERNLYVLWSQ